MKHSPDYYHNRRALLSVDNTPFKPTKQDIREWFDILNEQIFGNKLPFFDEVHIGRPRHVHAFFHCFPGAPELGTKLTICNRFSSKRLFVEILAHEMIHLFQHVYDEPLGHGPSFMAWSDNLQTRGLRLSKAA